MKSEKVKFLLRTAISLALIAFVLRKVDWHEFAAILKRIDFRLVAPASSLVLVLITSLAVRWTIFLRQQQIALPFRTVFALTWAGQFFNSVLPGSTGGDVVKIFQLCRIFPDKKAAAAASVLVDRFVAFVALIILASAALVIDPVPLWEIQRFAGSIKSTISIVGFLAVLLAGGTWIAFRYIRTTHWMGRLRRMFAALGNSLVLNKALFVALGISFGIHCLNFFIAFLFARALGVGISYVQCLLIFPVVLLLVMLPVTVNGHGLRELLLIFYFEHCHIVLSGAGGIGVRETVVAFSVVMVANDLLWSLPGGLWYMLRFKKVSV